MALCYASGKKFITYLHIIKIINKTKSEIRKTTAITTRIQTEKEGIIINIRARIIFHHLSAQVDRHYVLIAFTGEVQFIYTSVVHVSKLT